MSEVAILGAGLAGLSCAWHLQGRAEWSLDEREAEAGGLARTVGWGSGCLFDFTGHLLHGRDPEFVSLLQRLLPGGLAEHRRRAAVHSRGVRVPFPFQAHLFGLPPEVVGACLDGFARARSGEEEGADRESMAGWVRRSFGRGLEKHFFRPYLEKLYRTPLEELAADWTHWSIPVPSLEEVVAGALGLPAGDHGYNVTFHYPREGGIGRLPAALAAGLGGPLRLGEEAVAVDAGRRRVRFRGGREERYDALVSTLPLPRLLGMLEGAGPWASEAAQGLRHVAVACVNLVVGRERVIEEHWIYFPEPEYSFYRVGSPTNFSAAVAPPGLSTLYVEVSVPPGEQPDLEALQRQALAELVAAGILRGPGEVVEARTLLLDPAYVIHDRYRARELPGILERLRGLGILSTGRFGRWHYGTMESAVLDGREAAAEALALLGRPAAAEVRRG